MVAAALAGLDRGGVREAALAGIDEANRVPRPADMQQLPFTFYNFTPYNSSHTVSS